MDQIPSHKIKKNGRSFECETLKITKCRITNGALKSNPLTLELIFLLSLVHNSPIELSEPIGSFHATKSTQTSSIFNHGSPKPLQTERILVKPSEKIKTLIEDYSKFDSMIFFQISTELYQSMNKSKIIVEKLLIASKKSKSRPQNPEKWKII